MARPSGFQAWLGRSCSLRLCSSPCNTGHCRQQEGLRWDLMGTGTAPAASSALRCEIESPGRAHSCHGPSRSPGISSLFLLLYSWSKESVQEIPVCSDDCQRRGPVNVRTSKDCCALIKSYFIRFINTVFLPSLLAWILPYLISLLFHAPCPRPREAWRSLPSGPARSSCGTRSAGAAHPPRLLQQKPHAPLPVGTLHQGG